MTVSPTARQDAVLEAAAEGAAAAESAKAEADMAADRAAETEQTLKAANGRVSAADARMTQAGDLLMVCGHSVWRLSAAAFSSRQLDALGCSGGVRGGGVGRVGRSGGGGQDTGGNRVSQRHAEERNRPAWPARRATARQGCAAS